MKNNILVSLGDRLYEWLKKKEISSFLFSNKVKKDLQVLSREEKDYYVKKMIQAMRVALLCLIFVVVEIRNIYNVQTKEIHTLERPRADEESKEITLRAGEGVYTIEIAPYEMTEEEVLNAFDYLEKKLTDYILGANISEMEIVTDLYLPERIPGFPFSIYWESEQEQVIDSLGNVHREWLDEDQIIGLRAICSYGDFQGEVELGVQVLKENLSDEEKYKRDFARCLVEAEKDSRHEEVWDLPKEFLGEVLSYRMVTKLDRLAILIVAACAIGATLWFGADRDLRLERTKRQEVLGEAYLDFVSRLSLYISAGLNLQMAMQYCINDYTLKRAKGDLLCEILHCYERDMKNGYSFAVALDLFADRTDHISYRRLAGLLQQGFYNGTHDLAKMLIEEVEQIREEKRRQTKIKGEKMSSALIVPMLLQLCIVIVFIMMPAFSNMQF